MRLAHTSEDMRSYSSVSGTAQSMIGSSAAWSAEPHASWQWMRQWLQLDLGSVELVSGTVVQRGIENYQYVSKYVVKHSTDGSSWIDIAGEYSSVSNGTSTNLYESAQYAQHVRLIVIEWEGHISMRADAMLCHASSAPTRAPTRGAAQPL